ncbi:pentapeptide repeat-containing protein [Actinomadura nitritigenes]|uniref:pentapeptide repeat-containing protein n=1 Tax=Actinomadura nitritigenes TaxID=134602 RepID=UPI003D9451F1
MVAVSVGCAAPTRLGDDADVSWQGYDLDFTDIVFDGGDLRRAVFDSDHISFRGAWFEGGRGDFGGARFDDGTVDYSESWGQRPEVLPPGMADHLS